MPKTPAQNIIHDEYGNQFIVGDWFNSSLPKNIVLGCMSYPDTSYSFTTFFSKKEKGFVLGYASGNYGHGIFTAGSQGQIIVGNYVVLQCTRILSNLSVTIHNHCMFSWGSVISDSWISEATISLEVRRKMLKHASACKNRHIEFVDPKPIIIEENAWIGFDAVIMPGVTIGRGAVIGCKAVVMDSIPPYAVVIGNPGKIIKYLAPTDSEDYRLATINNVS